MPHRRSSSSAQPQQQVWPPPDADTHSSIDKAEALRISQMIDEGLKRDLEMRKKRKATRPEVKVMLLGQAESGKSTLRKQFQLFYASKSLEKERPAWRPVVYSNIVKAVRTILVALDDEVLAAPPTRAHLEPARTIPAPSLALRDTAEDTSAWHPELLKLRSKLLPLVALEEALATELSGGVSITGEHAGAYVRGDWQSLFTPASHLSWISEVRSPALGTAGRTSNVTNLAARTLGGVVDEIEELWWHPAVKQLLKKRQLELLDESAPFFLDNVRRIAKPDYLPATEDILNVRLRSLGIAEHAFEIDLGGQLFTWLLYDVGGARGQRPAWIPFFEDATAIIFLAPISAFDQYLEEDGNINRIDDSLQLWTAICSNMLLKKAALVLLLNKADLLRKKLAAGVKLNRFITSFGDRPNTFEEIADYFRAHFVQVHKRKDMSKRQLYVQFTSMLDIKETQRIIVSVNESIVRKHLADTGLLN